MLSVIFHIFVALGFRFKNIMKYAKKKKKSTNPNRKSVEF